MNSTMSLRHRCLWASSPRQMKQIAARLSAPSWWHPFALLMVTFSGGLVPVHKCRRRVILGAVTRRCDATCARRRESA